MRHKLERTALLEEAEALQRQLSAMKLELSAKLAAWQNNEADELDKNYPDIAALFEDVYKLQEHPCRTAFMLDQCKANHLQMLDRELEAQSKSPKHLKGMRWNEL